MPTKYPDLFAELAAPFAEHEVKTRSQAGRTFSYVTARTVMNRLDDVLGAENWSASYQPCGNSILCTLTIVLPDGSLVTKSDIGGHAGMQDAGDDDKSAASDATKRAAVHLGIGRYLYGDGTIQVAMERYEYDLPRGHQDGQYGGRGAAPARRDERAAGSAPQRDQGPQGQPQRQQGQGGGQGGNDRVPHTGRALFAWTKEMEQRYEVGLLKYLNGFSKLQEWPARMVDFDEEQVAQAYAEAIRKLREVADSRANQEEALAN